MVSVFHKCFTPFQIHKRGSVSMQGSIFYESVTMLDALRVLL
jgi:hypothetical protein